MRIGGKGEQLGKRWQRTLDPSVSEFPRTSRTQGSAHTREVDRGDLGEGLWLSASPRIKQETTSENSSWVIGLENICKLVR